MLLAWTPLAWLILPGLVLPGLVLGQRTIAGNATIVAFVDSCLEEQSMPQAAASNPGAGWWQRLLAPWR
jgi:hypothetical protein